MTRGHPDPHGSGRIAGHAGPGQQRADDHGQPTMAEGAPQQLRYGGSQSHRHSYSGPSRLKKQAERSSGMQGDQRRDALADEAAGAEQHPYRLH